MRGKVPYGVWCCWWSGITPAYAGKSDTLFRALLHFRDHPRLCGEKLYPDSLCMVLSGSPPPMRGKGDICIAADSRIGITPAYAGKSYQDITLFFFV